jgi:hypothetical protein
MFFDCSGVGAGTCGRAGNDIAPPPLRTRTIRWLFCLELSQRWFHYLELRNDNAEEIEEHTELE